MKPAMFCLFALITGLAQADPSSEVMAKAKRYLALSNYVQESDGFIETSACDALLFTGLYGAAGAEVQIEAARDGEGMWHRRPLSYPECYDKRSSSTISRDMLLGLLWYIWAHQRLDLAEDLFAYGEGHNWLMGKGDITRIYFTLNLQATLAEIIYHLGGKNHGAYRLIPPLYGKNSGSDAHIDVLHILLRGLVLGGIEAEAQEVLKYQAQRSPQNALFIYAWHQATDGEQSEAIQLLLNESWWPADRLPTSADRCDPWLTQRDEGEDWLPCPEQGKVHSGGDFLFVAWLLMLSN